MPAWSKKTQYGTLQAECNSRCAGACLVFTILIMCSWPGKYIHTRNP